MHSTYHDIDKSIYHEKCNNVVGAVIQYSNVTCISVGIGDKKTLRTVTAVVCSQS